MTRTRIASTSISSARANISSSTCPLAGRDERLERALGVLLRDHEVQVMLRLRPSTCPAGEPAAEQEGEVSLAEGAHRSFHRCQDVVELVGHWLGVPCCPG